MLAGLEELLLEKLLKDANRNNRAVPCFNVFNLDFLYTIITTAEEEKAPVIIALNQDMVNYYSLEVLVPLLLAYARQAQVPVCPHLDHSYDSAVVKRALELGLPSVMYDGSQLPLDENIKAMQEMGEITRHHQAGLEGEIGSVSYADNDPKKYHIRSELTQVEQAVRMSQETPVNALAISVGNVHRLSEGKADIDFKLLNKISEKVSTPLVIHGTSGIEDAVIHKIARETTVAKFNIATDLRLAWGKGLRKEFGSDSQLYDPLECSRRIHPHLKERVKHWINLLR